VSADQLIEFGGAFRDLIGFVIELVIKPSDALEISKIETVLGESDQFELSVTSNLTDYDITGLPLGESLYVKISGSLKGNFSGVCDFSNKCASGDATLCRLVLNPTENSNDATNVVMRVVSLRLTTPRVRKTNILGPYWVGGPKEFNVLEQQLGLKFKIGDE